LPTTLYLDTARLGRISSSAQQTHLEFVRLAAEEPSSLYFEEFLCSGYSAWPDSYRDRFPALSSWPGIDGLKTRLKQLAGGHVSSQVMIASRSAELMTLAARVLCKTCRSILTTDFNWPTYQLILQHEARRSGNPIQVAQLRASVLRNRMPPDELVARIVREFVSHNCDGLFLPAVDNWGIRLPITEIVTAIRRQAPLRFVVVDAAQAVAHVPIDDCLSVADFTIAGCHKWLRGYFPLGIAFFGQPNSGTLIADMAGSMLGKGELDDGLLRFCTQLTAADLDGYSETVNLGPLFSCCGALEDALKTNGGSSSGLAEQRTNAELVCHTARHSHWRPLAPQDAFRTGILLLEHRPSTGRIIDSEAVRRYFQDHRILATGYEGGLVRLSMPKRAFSDHDRCLLRQVLCNSA
jgi:selenocysteine lyase/cysteine desulfurase